MCFGSTVRPVCFDACVMNNMDTYFVGVSIVLQDSGDSVKISLVVFPKESFVLFITRVCFGMDLTQNARCISILSHCDFSTQISSRCHGL